MKKNNLDIQTLEVGGIYPAIFAMRNPMSSWEKSDSHKCDQHCNNTEQCKSYGQICIGKEDLKLSQKLTRAGSEHCKHLRMIEVWVNMTMPRYWWVEFDTYKHTEKLSTSTMHTIYKGELKTDHFYLGDIIIPRVYDVLLDTVSTINILIERYNTDKKYNHIRLIKRILPESFLQMRTVKVNYAQLMNIYNQRKNHRLKEEWGLFCEWCESLPLFYELCIGIDLTND